MGVFKEWRLECVQCCHITKFVGWSNLITEQPCEACGGQTLPEKLLERVRGVIADDIPGGMVMEHVEPGRKVYSRTELKQVLAAHRSERFPEGCSLSENGWCGPTDQFLSRWSAVPDMTTTHEERQQQMADWLGMTLADYQEAFG